MIDEFDPYGAEDSGMFDIDQITTFNNNEPADLDQFDYIDDLENFDDD